MAGDFNKILISEQYDTLLATITDLVKDMVKGLDPALALGTQNYPVNAIRWNSANGYWEKYNGTTWAALAASYAITITGSAAKWTNGRTITLTGAVTATSASWDGSGNLSIATTYSTIPVDKGGTNITSYAIGDILYASGSAALSKLADVAAGNVLLSGGVGAAPAYGKVGLTTHVDGVLPAANGGSGQSSYTIGDILYASGSNALSKLAAGTSGYFLKSGGTGVAPAWSALGAVTTSGLTQATGKMLGRSTAATGAIEEIAVGTGLSLSAGSLSCTVAGTTFASASENAAGTIENKAVDPLGIREAFNATGSAPVYACRAWALFYGTGTPAVRGGGNVTSITDNGVGDYTVNFTTAMPDANYSVVVAARPIVGGAYYTFAALDLSVAPAAGSCRVGMIPAGGSTRGDTDYFSISIFR